MILKVVFMCVFVSYVATNHEVKGDDVISDLELERELKILNKPSMETFVNEVGDTVDCVDIYKQPAFDHPLLKNHKIKMEPTTYPKPIVKTSTPINVKYFVPKSKCPQGSIPIGRVTKEGLKRAKTFSKLYSELLQPSIHPNTGLTPGKHVAISRSVYDSRNTYKGIQGKLNVYNPSLGGNNQSTGSSILIERGQPNVRNTLQAGWMASPALFGDNQPRSFVYWRVNEGSRGGGFNTFSAGFVQTSSVFHLGGPLQPSKYGDDVQSEVDYRIFQDKVTGDWWFDYPTLNITVGYWPKTLFTTLGNGQPANDVTWGGFAMGHTNGPSPQMGSGHFPSGDYRKGCYVRDILITTDGYVMTPPAPPKYQVEMFSNSLNCYRVQGYGYNGKWFGFSFLFGGPGGENCGP